MSPAFGGWEKEEQAGRRALPVPGCGKVEKPQKVGSKPERRERACKRTAQAQRDFLRGGAVLLPGGEQHRPNRQVRPAPGRSPLATVQAPSGYEGWLVMTYSPVKPYVGGAGWRLRRGLPPIGVAVSLAGGRFWARVWVREWVNSRSAKVAPLNKEKGGEKMRPLCLRAWGENPYGKWRDHPLFEQTTMYICDLYSEKQLSESEGCFCICARET